MSIRWIPVRDRLPVGDHDVLTWGRTTTASIRLADRFLGATKFGYGPDRGRFKNEAESDRWAMFTKLEVTHWAPINAPGQLPPDDEPGMLAALQRALPYLHPDLPEYEQVAAAIAKATGNAAANRTP